MLQDPVYPDMLKKVKEIICDEARKAKGPGAMRLQRCIAIKHGLNGPLDVARQIFCELVEDIGESYERVVRKRALV